MNRLLLVFLMLGLYAVSAVPAFADGGLFTAPTVDVTVIGTMITGIFAGLALMWAVRKGVKTINKS